MELTFWGWGGTKKQKFMKDKSGAMIIKQCDQSFFLETRITLKVHGGTLMPGKAP